MTDPTLSTNTDRHDHCSSMSPELSSPRIAVTSIVKPFEAPPTLSQSDPANRAMLGRSLPYRQFRRSARDGYLLEAVVDRGERDDHECQPGAHKRQADCQ